MGVSDIQNLLNTKKANKDVLRTCIQKISFEVPMGNTKWIIVVISFVMSVYRRNYSKIKLKTSELEVNH